RPDRPLPSARRGADGPPVATVTGAGGVVFDPGNRVLLLQHASGHWVFPKGHVEQGETQLQAALREVAEEAGVTATCAKPQRTWTTYYRNPRGVQRLITWFRCEADDTTTNVTEEAFVAGGFYAPSEAIELLTHRTDRDLLRRVLNEGERGS
ncbi:MAG TPA: NUDIX domain-containing protein, partial [Trueperaceae bacterium]|nr:NUDIX domain-containing protein [Trueperaceae bacterium]